MPPLESVQLLHDCRTSGFEFAIRPALGDVALAGDGPFAAGYREDPHAGVSTSVKVLIGVYGIRPKPLNCQNFRMSALVVMDL